MSSYAGRGWILLFSLSFSSVATPQEIYCIKRKLPSRCRSGFASICQTSGAYPGPHGEYAEIDPKPASLEKLTMLPHGAEGGEISRNLPESRLLPTYDVFDEDRYFSPGKVPLTRIFKGRKVAVSICEDIWNVDSSLHSQNPIAEICQEKPDLLINLSASPWHRGKQEQRINLLSKVVKQVNCPLCYVNSIGGNDELVFDGRSLAMGVDGDIDVPSAKAFPGNGCSS